MAEQSHVTIDGNEAAAQIAYSTSDLIITYPIAPASPMGELADSWSVAGRRNLWGGVPRVVQMQGENGVAGALHGALQAGALATTFTASQGLLLMLPDMYRIAGGLWPCVIHVAARSVATHASSIYGDHSDVMAVRQAGWAILASASVQEAHDLALVAHAATLAARVPFLHCFDGFRTSHELSKITAIPPSVVELLIDGQLVAAHRQRAMNPARPVLRGATHGPECFFPGREAANSHYDAVPSLVQAAMDQLAVHTGRAYRLFEYVGHPAAEHVVVLMGSAFGAAEEALAQLVARGEKVGLVQVRLLRPFDAAALRRVLPPTVQRVTVLDRTKEPGAAGEPLYLEVLAAVATDAAAPRVRGGRYGLSSCEFTPAMAAAVLRETPSECEGHSSADALRRSFTIGITDDVTGRSVAWDPDFAAEPADVLRAVFFGTGGDGCVAANRMTLEIIGQYTPLFTQGYFVFDSRKIHPVVVSHLRFSPRPIRSSYLVQRANFVAVSQGALLDRLPVLELAELGGTLLLNTAIGPQDIWAHLRHGVRAAIQKKRLRFCVVDANRVATEVGAGENIGTIMQMCFFWLSNVLPHAQAVEQVKHAIQHTFGKRGRSVVEQNIAAADKALDRFREVKVPDCDLEMTDSAACSSGSEGSTRADDAPAEVTLRARLLPVSAVPADGTYATGTGVREPRTLPGAIPIWRAALCTECGSCALVCPHAAIRIKAYPNATVQGAPEGFASRESTALELREHRLTVQVLPDDCTGCGQCVDVCPARDKQAARLKAINMEPTAGHLERQRSCARYFLEIPDLERTRVPVTSVLGSQLLRPLFQFSSACAGCGETPYLKLLSQLFGDRAVIANATGCSSVYGGQLPESPWTTDSSGRGPAWANSLFEDNAEFGLGMRLALDEQRSQALRLLRELSAELGADLVTECSDSAQSNEAEIARQRQRVAVLLERLQQIDSPASHALRNLADVLIRRSVWIVGGDGWANDIGFGGLDHVLQSGQDVNVLVLDTGLYSSTGGQWSKSTPRAAVAKFAALGRSQRRQDLGQLAMTCRQVYVAQVAFGADPQQALRAFHEAESYAGPSLILAYSHCVAHGVNMTTAMTHQRQVVQSGLWPLYRFDPRRAGRGESPLQLDSEEPKLPFKTLAMTEARFAMLARTNPDHARQLFDAAQQDIKDRWSVLLEDKKPKP